MFIDIGHVAQTHVLRDHALRLRTSGGIEDTRTHHIVRNAQQCRKTQDDVRVVRNISIGKHGLHLAIRYQGHAVAIIDHPTRRRSAHGGVEIRFSFALVARRAHRLQAEELHASAESSRNDDPDRKETIALSIDARGGGARRRIRSVADACAIDLGACAEIPTEEMERTPILLRCRTYEGTPAGRTPRAR